MQRSCGSSIYQPLGSPTKILQQLPKSPALVLETLPFHPLESRPDRFLFFSSPGDPWAAAMADESKRPSFTSFWKKSKDEREGKQLTFVSSSGGQPANCKHALFLAFFPQVFRVFCRFFFIQLRMIYMTSQCRCPSSRGVSFRCLTWCGIMTSMIALSIRHSLVFDPRVKQLGISSPLTYSARHFITHEPSLTAPTSDVSQSSP